MNVSLTPELEKFIDDRVETGMYTSASEVVRAGLRLLREHEELQQRRLEELRKEVAIGVRQAERGEVSTLDAGELKRRLDKRLSGQSSGNGR